MGDITKVENCTVQRIPTIDDIRDAARRIAPYIHRTPVLTSHSINHITGCEIFFKCENFQKVGAFKARGATNAVFSLNAEEAAAGVATHSSGNHAAALALAAMYRGTKSYIVMPRTAPRVKKDAVKGYRAEITDCEPTLSAREAGLAEVVKQTGATFIHPYNDYRIIAGQATASLELLNEISGLDIVLTPVGGGGLTSGTALTVKSLSPRTQMIAVEPEMADDAYRSFKQGKIFPSVNPKTVADGLLTSLGDKTFAVIRKYVDDIVTVSEAGIIQAMRIIWERMKIIVEPSAAVPLAAIIENKISIKGKKVGIILSGGNVDLDKLPWLKPDA
jgi:threonine dehydratase